MTRLFILGGWLLATLALANHDDTQRRPRPVADEPETRVIKQKKWSCSATFPSGENIVLRIEGKSVDIQLTNRRDQVPFRRKFAQPAWAWDGHKTGMITAPGLSVVYENHYSILRNVRIHMIVNEANTFAFLDGVKIDECSTPFD